MPCRTGHERSILPKLLDERPEAEVTAQQLQPSSTRTRAARSAARCGPAGANGLCGWFLPPRRRPAPSTGRGVPCRGLGRRAEPLGVVRAVFRSSWTSSQKNAENRAAVGASRTESRDDEQVHGSNWRPAVKEDPRLVIGNLYCSHSGRVGLDPDWRSGCARRHERHLAAFAVVVLEPVSDWDCYVLSSPGGSGSPQAGTPRKHSGASATKGYS